MPSMKLSNHSIPYFLIVASALILVLSSFINQHVLHTIHSLRGRISLEHAIKNYNEARSHGASESMLCERLINIAGAYSDIGDNANSETYKRKALTLFLKQEIDEIDLDQFNGVLRTIQFLALKKEINLAQAYFQKAIEIGERHYASDSHWGNDLLEMSTAVESIAPEDEKPELLKFWIAQRKKNSGYNNENLATLYCMLAQHYQRLGHSKEAESTIQDSRYLDYHSPENKLDNEIRVAHFYAGINDKDKAQQICRKILENNKKGFYSDITPKIRNILSIYGQLDLDEEQIKAISDLLANPSRRAFLDIDFFLIPQIRRLIGELRYSEAEVLVRRRINAGSEFPGADVRGHWKLVLSNILLAKQEKAESNKLFREVINSRLLREECVLETAREREDALRKFSLAK